MTVELRYPGKPAPSPSSPHLVPWGLGLGMGPRAPPSCCMEHKECKQFPVPQADYSLYTDPLCAMGGYLGNGPCPNLPRTWLPKKNLCSSIPGYTTQATAHHLPTAHLHHICSRFKPLRTIPLYSVGSKQVCDSSQPYVHPIYFYPEAA